jgi:hypothetical protein
MAGRRTRKAILPEAGYTRPASLDDGGLNVTVYEEDGTVAGVCDFTRLPGSAEQRRGFALASLRQERDDFRTAAETFARAVHVLTVENDILRRELDNRRLTGVTALSTTRL